MSGIKELWRRCVEAQEELEQRIASTPKTYPWKPKEHPWDKKEGDHGPTPQAKTDDV